MNIFRKLVDSFKDLEAKLASVDSEPAVQRFGQAVRRARRIEQISDWRENSLGMVANFRSTELPALKAQRATDIAAARKIIERGGPLASKDLPNRDSTLNGDVVSRLDSFERALLAATGGLSRQLAVSNAFTVAQLSTTEDLQRQIEQYTADARTALKFPLEQFSIDRLVFPTVLASRAASDPRAALALESFGQIEASLCERAAPNVFSENGGEDLGKLEEIIGSAVRGGEENLTPAAEFLNFVSRGLDRQALHLAANPPLSFPKNRE